MSIKIREIRIEGNIAYVPLTKGYEAIIDAVHAEKIGRWNWHARIDRKSVYACRSKPRGYGPREVRMHNDILGKKDKLEVDHINRNTLDNRTKNLRFATKSQNQCNRSIQKNNRSGFKGVSFDSKNNKWQAHICFNKKRKNLGRFNTKQEAYSAYCKASAELHGEFQSL
jgi:hypothetical protein